jgi:hypothetical protein
LQTAPAAPAHRPRSARPLPCAGSIAVSFDLGSDLGTSYDAFGDPAPRLRFL